MTNSTDESFEVSPQQEALWLAEPDGPAGQIQATVSLTGSLDAAALRAALRRTVERHEILRTTFVRRPGIRVPLQVVHDALDPALEMVELAAAPAADQVERMAAIGAQELGAALDFAAGPLLRAVLVARGDDRHALVLTVSSLCADAASLALLVRELAHALTGEGTLVEEPLQYADFAAWQVELGSSEDGEALSARESWRALEGATATALPFARTPEGTPLAGETAGVVLEAPLADALSQVAERSGATLEALVHAAWCAVLARSAGADEAALAFVPSARRHADLDGAIGAISGSVPQIVPVPASATVAELLGAVLAARADAPVLVDYAPAGGGARFAIGLVAAEGVNVTSDRLSVELERVLDTGRGLGLALTCLTGAGAAPRLELSFDSRRHDRDDVERLARRLERALEALAADPGVAAADLGVPVADLDILGEAERRLLLVEWGDTAAPVPIGAVHELFAHHAAASPSRSATIDEHGALTYAGLDARSNQLANHLRAAGVGPGAAVGLCTDRSNDMVVGLLGILKSGAAYVPLHYEHPRMRLGQQLETAGATAVVTQAPLLERLPRFAGETVCLDRDRAALDAEPVTAPEVTVGADDPAYVIYTSGSTGTPKGVEVTHANLVNYARFIAARLGADREPLSFGVVTSIATDLGNTSVFGALCSGGTLVLVSPEAAADAGQLAKQLDATPLDVLKITPSHVGALIAGGDARVLPRRRLVLGGERAPWDLVDRVRALSAVGILNHYGPTEATVGCCTFEVPEGRGEYPTASVPIGAPIANIRCYLLDDRRRPVPLGAPGQLFVAGAGVARGYVGAPELTAERFLPDPFSSPPGGTMYDTGDLARWLPDGTLEFLGRADEQVKIRGYRVELGEIEAVLRRHTLVEEAVVVAHEGAAGDHRLIAYCQTSGPVEPEILKRFLAEWLPDFMQPSAIGVLDALPRTPSGKIDRRALPDPETLAAPTEDYVAPSTPMEEAVAAIWAQVLGVERVGARDDFFDLGGHSLLATQVVAQVRTELAVDLPLHSLFAYSTVSALAAEIVRMIGDSEADETARLVAELEGLSDEEAEALLAAEAAPPEPGQR